MDEELLKILSWNKSDLYQWEGFWCNPSIMTATMDLKATFKSVPNDVLLASSMKTGSTWLKAICVCIMQGNKEEEEDLLVKNNPHFQVPTIEAMKNEEDLEIVLNKCSLERLKNLEVNKSGSLFYGIPTNSYFRKGIIGDWKNHMTPKMEERLDKLTSLKLQGSGLQL
ncbi:hypothetical protein KY285_037588 [Solanum tuberosum]|nr:hypothetical protein KY285_037588 [Solanum tuberosum]